MYIFKKEFFFQFRFRGNKRQILNLTKMNNISESTAISIIEFNTVHQRVVNKLRNLPVEKLLAIEVLIDPKPKKNLKKNLKPTIKKN